MLQSTTYEVWVQAGSRWEIHSRYAKRDHDQAIEEAKDLERYNPTLNVRVVREDYNPATGLADELVVYSSPRRRNTFAKGLGPSGGGGGWARGDDFDSDPEKASGKKGVTRTALFAMMSMLTLGSAAMATVLTYIGSFVVHRGGSFGLPGKGSKSDLLYAVFIISFVLIALVVNGAYLSRIDLDSLAGKRGPPQPKAQPPKPFRIPEPAEPLPEPEPAPEPEPEEAAQPAEDPAPEPERAGESDAPTEDAVGEDEPLSLAGEREKLRMMTFFRAVLDEAKNAGIRLDTFARFGFNLFLAGAIDVLGGATGLQRNEVGKILQDMVELLGARGPQAKAFAFAFEDYLLNPRHLAMFEAGRHAMLPFLEGDAEGAHQLVAALNAWLDPAAKAETGNTMVAVMFTDMVGSTGQTQVVGDLAAQYVVRTHNRVVRAALANNGGKEIKHTGDGIMASFGSTASAVEAAIEIQRRSAVANQAEPDLPFPLHVRIGINAGEPVTEDNDLFGATVQLAARICGSASIDEIAVTSIVHHLCAGKSFHMTSRGRQALKGFADPVEVFVVQWQESPETDVKKPAPPAAKPVPPPAAPRRTERTAAPRP